jgi:hypothetical protein
LLRDKYEVQVLVNAVLFEPFDSRKHGGLDVLDVFRADVWNREELVSSRSKDERVVHLVQLCYVYHAFSMRARAEFFELGLFLYLPKHDVHQIEVSVSCQKH